MPTLKQHRRRIVLSTRELAEKAKVSPATIWRIERGDVARIRPATMRSIARVLKVAPDDIDEFANVLDSNFQSEKSRDLMAMAARQGVKPVGDPRQLVGDFWPSQEEAEDFVSTLYKWRSEGSRLKNLR